MKKIKQNDVSVFIAGFKAGLLMTDYFEKDLKYFSPDCIEQFDYKSVVLGNITRGLLSEYKKGEFDDTGLDRMYAQISLMKKAYFGLSDEDKNKI